MVKRTNKRNQQILRARRKPKKGILFSLQKGKGRLDEKIKGEHLLERVKHLKKGRVYTT